MTTDEKILALGYEVIDIDRLPNNIVYFNKKDQQEVGIQWDDDDEECLIYVRDTNCAFKESMVGFANTTLNIKEIMVFLEKIEEMRKGNKS